MSEVKRFRADHRHVVETEFDDAQFVLASDYDAAQAELAALREELETSRAAHQITAQAATSAQKRLTAAEQRNAELERRLKHFANCADVRQVGAMAMDFVAALKPTESGASEEPVTRDYPHGESFYRNKDAD